MKKTVYYLGNPFVDKDRLPLKIIHSLRKVLPHFDFIHLDPTEEFATTNQELIIIDIVIGITKVIKFNDLNQWTLSPRTTVHDFDLPVSLGLLQKLGKVKKVTIIGIPPKETGIKIVEEIVKILKSL